MAGEPTINPYAAPRSDVEVPPTERGPGAFPRPLFSTGQAFVAAFFGTPVAGVILMQANYRAMGRSRAANKALLLGLLASIAIMAGLMALPRGASTPVNIGIAYGFRRLIDSLQGQSLSTHLGAGGARQSNWVVFGIIVATIAAVFLLVAAVLFASGRLLGYD